MGCRRIWVGGAGDFPFGSRRVSQARRKGAVTITGPGGKTRWAIVELDDRRISDTNQPFRQPSGNEQECPIWVIRRSQPNWLSRVECGNWMSQNDLVRRIKNGSVERYFL